MPTYRVSPVTDTQALSEWTYYALSCEQCRAPLAAAPTPAELTGLSAEAVLGLWPRLALAVKTHEHRCPGRTGAAPKRPGLAVNGTRAGGA